MDSLNKSETTPTRRVLEMALGKVANIRITYYLHEFASNLITVVVWVISLAHGAVHKLLNKPSYDHMKS